MKILNTSKQTILAEEGQMANTLFSRMVGLLNRKALKEKEALVITKCNSIHMFFMRFAIDVVFADKNSRVVGLVENIKPFRLSKIYFKASYAIELPVGTIASSGTSLGDIVQISQ